MSDLNDILEGKEEEAEVEATQTEETEVSQETQAETQETTGEEDSAPPAEETDREDGSEKEKAYWAAVADERKKRQALEQEIERLKSSIEKPEEKPDFWENPEAAISTQVQSIKQEFDNKFYNLSEMNARMRHEEDFDDMKAFFLDELAAKNPALVAEAQAQPDPYEYVYQTAKKHKAISEVGDVDSFKSKIKDEVKSEYEAKIKELEAKLNEKSLPGSLSEARSAGGSTSAESDALEDVLGR